VLAVAALIVAADQAGKALAVATLSGREPVSLLGGLLTLRLVRNPGAAFGLAEGATVLLTLIAVAVTVAVVRLSARLASTPWAVSLGLLLGGAVGNLVDRLVRSPGPLRGHVVDFLELPHWPVFNLADSAIVVAGVTLVLYSLLGLEPEGRSRDRDPGTDVGPTDH
jgi:signal peptidase II